MKSLLKTVMLSLAVLIYTATSASAVGFFDSDEPKAKKPAQTTVQPYKSSTEPRAPIYAPVAPKADVKKQPAPQRALPGVRAYPKAWPLHGNPDSKIYHAYDCQYYDSKSATEEFATAKAAEKAGYSPCKVCEGKEGVANAKRQQSQEQQASKRVMLHGNPTTKTLHGPSCRYYDSKAASENFASVEAAKKAGYSLCTICEGK